jgi:ribosomal protein S18 acetylase RimI-like enzyme
MSSATAKSSISASTPDMDMPEIEVRIVRRVDREQVKRLYSEAGWWEPEDEQSSSWIDRMVEGSFCFAGAFTGDRMVGMARAISDGASDAYIQDVTVLPDYRHQGIGRRLIAALIECLKEKKINWIGLVSEPGSQPLYERLGFEPLVGHVPMRLRR